MIVYMRCSKCHHQEKAKPEALFGSSICPKCGYTGIDTYMNTKGGQPDWWKEPEPQKIKRDPLEKPVHLKIDLYTAPKHAQECMKDLGISYEKSVPQSLYDSWWFFNCTNIPDNLPEWISVFDVDPVDCIGHGLTPEDVEKLK